MMHWEFLRKTAMLAVGLMLWMTVVPSLLLNARQEDVLQKARGLIEAGELESAIGLLEGYVAKIRTDPGQKTKLAEAAYVLARAYYMVYQDQKSDDYLRLVFAAAPGYSVPETNKNFLGRVEKVRAESVAVKQAEEPRKLEAEKEALAQRKAEEAWKAAVEKKAAEDRKKAEAEAEKKAAEDEKKAIELAKAEAAKAEEKPKSVAGEPEGGPPVKKKGKFPWLVVGAVAAVGIVAAVLLSKKSGGKSTTTTSVPPTTGNISITSTPTGAKVTLDGSDTGKTTPCTLTGIAPGSHTLLLELSNYGKWSGSVEVKSGQTADVSVTLAGFSYQFVMNWGEMGSNDGQLWNPAGIAADSSGNIFVADSGNYRVQRFTAQGAYTRRWGSSGSGDYQFRTPLGIAVDSTGNVFVADTGNCRIVKYNGDGDYLDQFGSRGTGELEFLSPRGVAVDRFGDIYVADADNHRFTKLNAGGDFLMWGGGQGSGDAKFNHPSGIAVDASGNIYIADADNHRIQKLSSSGAFITKWGSSGTGPGQFNTPTAIAVDSSRYVYVADSKNNRVQKFNENGVFMTQWGGAGTSAGQFYEPRGVAVDAAGYVYVTDFSNHRVQKFRLTSITQATAKITYSSAESGARSTAAVPHPSLLPGSLEKTEVNVGPGQVPRKKEPQRETTKGTIR